jgi:endo-1,4-beta-xylanase
MSGKGFAAARSWIALTFAVAALMPAPGAAQALRQAADRAGVLIGTAVRPERLSEAAYAATLAREFNLLEPEDALKWEVIRARKGSFNFAPADQAVGFAMAHGMKVRGHTLVWGRHNPDWLPDSAYTPAQLSALLEEHIAAVAGRYRGKVFAWDVVNEAFDEAGALRGSIWYDQPGIGFAGKGAAYMEQAFRWARAADPEALLFLNEAEGETVNAKSDAIFAMVQDFRARHVPIDGIGLQMHLAGLNPDVASLSANIARFTALGMEVHITEMDVALPLDPGGGVSEAALARQAQVYRDVANACLAHRGCRVIQTWGFTDKYSWIGSSSRGRKGFALPFDRTYQPKPAWRGLLQALQDHAKAP